MRKPQDLSSWFVVLTLLSNGKIKRERDLLTFLRPSQKISTLYFFFCTNFRNPIEFQKWSKKIRLVLIHSCCTWSFCSIQLFVTRPLEMIRFLFKDNKLFLNCQMSYMNIICCIKMQPTPFRPAIQQFFLYF